MSQVDPSSMVQDSQVEELLKDLDLPLKQDPKAEKRQLLTFDNPHSCEHCRDDFVQINQEHTVIHCPCGWSGKGTASSPEYRACGGCGKLHDNEVLREYSASLQYGLKYGAAAARSGCLFYEFFVSEFPVKDVVRVLNKRHSWDTIEHLLTVGKSYLEWSLTTLENVPEGCSIRWGLSTKSVHYVGGALRMWAIPGDGASKFIDSRPYESNVDSNASWDFARRCLDKCRESHGRCRERLTDTSDTRLRQGGGSVGSEWTDLVNIPSRLLDVQAGTESHIRLVNVDSLSDDKQAVLCSSGFAALSYCWGGQQSLTLTKSGSEHLYDDFSPEKLPKTIQDAVRVVRNIGLRYLWVDALCIQQDSDEDKTAEISRMETYYGSATVTICAAAASSAEQGFLSNRKSPSFKRGPFQIPLRNTNGTDEGHVYLLLEAEASPEPTATRGWAMQESLLSRRILIYSQRQLYWSCSTSMCGCGGDIVSMEDKVSGSEASLVNDIYPIGASLQLPTTNQWQILLMNYTTRQLGFPSDKLLAISALVSHVWDVSRERNEEPAYIAGLLVNLSNRMSFLIQLQWRVLDPSKSSRASVYRAPSWSWAAIEGPIWNHASWDDRSNSKPPDEAVIESYSVQLVHENLPFGSVSGAHMVIQARMRRLCECIDIPDLPLFIRTSSSQWPFINLFPDTEEDTRAIEEVIETKGDSGDEISLLLLQESNGIIVSPTASGDMVRIGVFIIEEVKVPDDTCRKIVFETCIPTCIRLL
ncbi:hypothetical protein CDV31_004872 [Fusarium ambrosium]|uniref:Heterokaryon incompatibility domain-containing protein n=1 Tax=Fusarium ambrosium TaxID=131363 RepID=A0A428UN76_9HYPO|nr:hypothetical protein CDV31_004872 [Fusarium ambrosium]